MKLTLLLRKVEAIVFLLIFGLFFGYIGSIMGVANMVSTFMNTAFDLLSNTVFYIMGITVLSGALGKLIIEFGVIRLLEFILAPLMRPLFNLPGVAALGGVITFFSDNPAIISLANDKNFKKYFKKHELISLTNFGTSFGMGLIVLTFMSTLTIGDKGKGIFFIPALIGLAGAIIGAAISTRIMQFLIKKDAKLAKEDEEVDREGNKALISYKNEESVFLRFLNAILDGGKQGVDLGLSIIPGVLIISSFIMIITFGPGQGNEYSGAAYEGIGLLPKVMSYFTWLFKPLFGFEKPELIAFPITSLGAVGAALSLVKKFIAQNLITGNEIAVFTAMGMCWSGYLSTHTAMLDALKYRHLTSKALIAHTVGGICAGVAAHYIYILVQLIFHLP